MRVLLKRQSCGQRPEFLSGGSSTSRASSALSFRGRGPWATVISSASPGIGLGNIPSKKLSDSLAFESHYNGATAIHRASLETQVNENTALAQQDISLLLTGYTPALTNARFTLCTIAHLSRVDIQIGMTMHLIPCVLQTVGLAIEQLPDLGDITIHGLELRSLDVVEDIGSEPGALFPSEGSAPQLSPVLFTHTLPTATSQSDGWNTESLDIVQLEQQALLSVPRPSASFLLSAPALSQAQEAALSLTSEIAERLYESQFINSHARRRLHRYRQNDIIFSSFEACLEQLFSIKALDVSGEGYAPFYNVERDCLEWSPVTILGKYGQCFVVRKNNISENNNDTDEAPKLTYCNQRKVVLSYLNIPRSLGISLNLISLNSVSPLAEGQMYDIFSMDIANMHTSYGVMDSRMELKAEENLTALLSNPACDIQAQATTYWASQRGLHTYYSQPPLESSEQTTDIGSISPTDIQYSGLVLPRMHVKKNSILPERKSRRLFPLKEATSHDTVRVDFEAFLSKVALPYKSLDSSQSKLIIQLFDRYREYHLIRNCFWKRLASLDRLARTKMEVNNQKSTMMHYLELILQRITMPSDLLGTVSLEKTLTEKRREIQVYYRALIANPDSRRQERLCNVRILQLAQLVFEARLNYFNYKVHIPLHGTEVAIPTSVELCMLSLMRTLPFFKSLVNYKDPISYLIAETIDTDDNSPHSDTRITQFHSYRPVLGSDFASVSDAPEDLSDGGKVLTFDTLDYCRQLSMDYLTHAHYVDCQLEVLMEALKMPTHKLHTFSHTFFKLTLNSSRFWNLQESAKSISRRTKKMYSDARQAIDGNPFIIPGKCVSAYLAFAQRVVTKCLPLISMPLSILSTIMGPYSPTVPSFIKSNMVFTSDLAIDYYRRMYMRVLDTYPSAIVRLIELPTEVIRKELMQAHTKTPYFPGTVESYHELGGERCEKEMHDMLYQLNRVSFSRRISSASTTMEQTACLRAFTNPQVFNCALLLNEEAASPRTSPIGTTHSIFDIDNFREKDPKAAAFIPYSLLDSTLDSNILLNNLSRCLTNSFICFYNIVAPYIQEALSDECYKNYRAVVEERIAQHKIDHGLLTISSIDRDRISLHTFNSVRSLFTEVLKLAEIIIHRTFHEAIEERFIPQWIVFLLATIHGGHAPRDCKFAVPASTTDNTDPAEVLVEHINQVVEQSLMCSDYSFAGTCPETTQLIVTGLDGLTNALYRYLYLTPNTEVFYRNIATDLSILNRGLSNKIDLSTQEITDALTYSEAIEFSLLPRYDVHRRLESCYFSGDPLNWEEALPLFINDLIHYYRGRPLFCDLILTPNLSVKLFSSLPNVPSRSNPLLTEESSLDNRIDKENDAHVEDVDASVLSNAFKISQSDSFGNHVQASTNTMDSSADELPYSRTSSTNCSTASSSCAQLSVSKRISNVEGTDQKPVTSSLSSSAVLRCEQEDIVDTASPGDHTTITDTSSPKISSPPPAPTYIAASADTHVVSHDLTFEFVKKQSINLDAINSLHAAGPSTLEWLVTSPEPQSTCVPKLTLYSSFLQSFYLSNADFDDNCISISQFYRKLSESTVYTANRAPVTRARSSAHATRKAFTLEYKPLRPISQRKALLSGELLDASLNSDDEGINEELPRQFLRKALRQDLPESDTVVLLRKLAVLAGRRVAQYFRPICHVFGIYTSKVRSQLFALLQVQDLLPLQFFSHSWLSNAILSAFLCEASKLDLLINKNIQSTIKRRPAYYEEDGSFSYQKLLEQHKRKVNDSVLKEGSLRLGLQEGETNDRENSSIRFQSFVRDDTYSMGHSVCSEEIRSMERGVPEGSEDAYNVLRQEFAASYRYSLGATIPTQRAIELKLQLILEFIQTKRLITLLPFNMPLGTPSHTEIVSALLVGAANSCKSLVATLAQMQALVKMINSIPQQAYYGVYVIRMSHAITALKKECAFVMQHLCKRITGYHTIACSILAHSMDLLKDAIERSDDSAESLAMKHKQIGGVMMANMPRWSGCLHEVDLVLSDVSDIGSGSWPSRLYGDLLRNVVDIRHRYIQLINTVVAITGMTPLQRREPRASFEGNSYMCRQASNINGIQ